MAAKHIYKLQAKFAEDLRGPHRNPGAGSNNKSCVWGSKLSSQAQLRWPRRWRERESAARLPGPARAPAPGPGNPATYARCSTIMYGEMDPDPGALKL
eukprot:16429169-Heterocapsa_arctica.AAC.1